MAFEGDQGGCLREACVGAVSQGSEKKGGWGYTWGDGLAEMAPVEPFYLEREGSSLLALDRPLGSTESC